MWTRRGLLKWCRVGRPFETMGERVEPSDTFGTASVFHPHPCGLTVQTLDCRCVAVCVGAYGYAIGQDESPDNECPIRAGPERLSGRRSDTPKQSKHSPLLFLLC